MEAEELRQRIPHTLYRTPEWRLFEGTGEADGTRYAILGSLIAAQKARQIFGSQLCLSAPKLEIMREFRKTNHQQ